MATTTYRYRIYPNKEQAETMARFFGCARKVYNLCLSWWKEAYGQYKEDGTPIGKMPDYSYYKSLEEYAYLNECDAVALQQARRHFQDAIGSFLKSRKGQRNEKAAGFPKFKRKGVSKDTYTTFNNNNAVKLSADGRHIRLPKLGDVTHKRVVAFGMILRQVHVFVHIEGDDMLKRYHSFFVQFNQGFVHSQR